MRKLKWGIVCLTMGLVLFSGCTGSIKQDETTISSNQKERKPGKSSSKKSNSEFKEKQFNQMIEASQTQIPSMLKQFEGMISDLSIEAGENTTIIYKNTYVNPVEIEIDTEALKPSLAKNLKATVDSLKGMFPDIKIQVIYLNPDKTEVANLMITQEDIEKLASDDS